MADDRLMHLLQDCDGYVERQRRLLDLAAALGAPDGSIVAMDAAVDQLAAAVASTWQLVRAEPGGSDGLRPDRLGGHDPGE